jgi:hypothetical protein
MMELNPADWEEPAFIGSEKFLKGGQGRYKR